MHTLEIGKFIANETILHCPDCDKIYPSELLSNLVQRRCNFGYDVMVLIGEEIFLRCRNVEEIIHRLKAMNVLISPSEISYLAKKFIIYLSLAHRESQKEIRKFMYLQGGYIFHLDATCDGGSPHLMSGLDGISEIVLANVKLPSEKKDKIIPFLQGIKNEYGSPRALVHDMGRGILSAIEEVFPGTPDFICHLHFLRDIGKDLLGKEYDQIRNLLRKHNIRSKLRKKAKAFEEVIGENQELIDSLKKSIENKELIQSCFVQTSVHSIRPGMDLPIITAYVLILWALDANYQLDGYGFPFDRFYLEFYERLKCIHSVFQYLKTIYLCRNWEDLCSIR